MKCIFSILTFLVCFFTTTHAQLPAWEWAKSTGDIYSERGSSVATDSDNNIYVTGYFTSYTITFGNITLNNTAPGYRDIFVVKYDSMGNVIWAVSAGGLIEEYVYDIAVDKQGNAYITGSTSSYNCYFGNLTLSGTYLGDYFLTKISSGGSFEWILTSNDANGYEGGNKIIVDENNDIIVAGIFNGTQIGFGNILHINKAEYTFDVFLNKYSSEGSLIWSISFGGISNDEILDLANDEDNNIFATGSSESDVVVLQNNTIYKGPIYNMGVITLKFDSNGSDLWIKSLFKEMPGNKNGFGISYSSNGKVYVCGSFKSDSIVFANKAYYNSNSNYSGDAMILIYDTDGNEVSAKVFGGYYAEEGVGVNHLQDGSLIFNMNYTSPTINGFVSTNPTNPFGASASLIAKFNLSDTDVWVTPINGSAYDYVNKVAVDNSGNLILTGHFNSWDLVLGKDSLYSNGTEDFFVAKLLTSGAPSSINENTDDPLQIFIYPNPIHNNLYISGGLKGTLVIKIYSVEGKLVYESAPQLNEKESYLDLTHLPAGTYLMNITNMEQKQIHRMFQKL